MIIGKDMLHVTISVVLVTVTQIMFGIPRLTRAALTSYSAMHEHEGMIQLFAAAKCN